MDYKDLSPELREEAKKCTTPEEFLELAKREGIQLNNEQLEAINGGDGGWGSSDCDWFDTCSSDL